MPRPTGTFVIKCTTKRCKGKLVAKPGEVGVCNKCGAKVRFTKSLLKSLGKKI